MGLNNRILVIDNNKEVLRLVSRIMEDEEFNVMTAANGKSAIDLLESFQPHLVILNIKMPELDGFQVLDFIRERSDVPIIMLTGIIDKATLYDAITLGVDDFVTKPFYNHELVSRVRAKLRRSKLVRNNDN